MKKPVLVFRRKNYIYEKIESMEVKAEVEVSSISLSYLFKNYILEIPEFQRPYVWTNVEIDKLLYQFSEHEKGIIDNKPNFYLGSIVLHNENNKFKIIDGQQRITTLQILGLLKGKEVIETSYSHPISIKNIKKNHQFYQSTNGEIELIDFEKINITIVVTNNEDLAYNFFETLNTGGKRLDGTDVLKAHHLRCVSNIDERNSFAVKWEKRQKNLEVVNRMLSKIRRLDYLNRHSFVPNKFSSDDIWKNILTEDFAEKAKKSNRDIGYSSVEIEENTHTITSDKYAIRQPLNQGINYINYLLNFTNDYNYLFSQHEIKNDKYTKFNIEIINVIDGTADIRHFYQIALLCFVDKFGRKNILEFSMYLFRYIYSLRLKDQARVYEATVINFITDTKILERIFNAFTYDEISHYLKNYKVEIKLNDISGVKQRYYERVNNFFDNKITKENFDSNLLIAIDNYLK